QYSFIETVEAMHPYYVVRALGGVLFLTGAAIMAYNMYRTVRGDVRAERPFEAAPGVAAAE
ncbi:MAG: cytochrome oxidase, partial [Rhodospirillaceae bacterium]